MLPRSASSQNWPRNCCLSQTSVSTWRRSAEVNKACFANGPTPCHAHSPCVLFLPGESRQCSPDRRPLDQRGAGRWLLLLLWGLPPVCSLPAAAARDHPRQACPVHPFGPKGVPGRFHARLAVAASLVPATTTRNLEDTWPPVGLDMQRCSRSAFCLCVAGGSGLKHPLG